MNLKNHIFRAKGLSWLLTIILLLSFSQSFAQITTLWEKSMSTGNRPTWMSTTDLERGFAYKPGTPGNDRLYVVSRNGGTKVLVLNATTGDSVGMLNTTGISHGTYLVNDVELSSDGIIFVANLKLGGTDTLKVYKYTSESAAPVNVIAFGSGNAARLGDKFTAVGSASDNSLKLYFASATNPRVFIFSTADNGNTFTVDSLILTGPSLATSPFLGSSPSLAPVQLGNNYFFVNGGGINPRYFDRTTGAQIGMIPGSIIPTGSNTIRQFSYNSKNYIATLVTGTTNHNIRIVDYTDAVDSATFVTNCKFVGMTSVLGTATNTNAVGDLHVQDMGNGVFDMFLLTTNNGLGRYRVFLNPAANTATINTLPYSLDFETGLVPSDGWTSNMWQRGKSVNSGLYSARAIYNYSSIVEGILLSPKINLPAGTRITYYWRDADISARIAGNDTTFFEISTDGGATWTSLDTLSAPSSQSVYSKRVINLSAFSGANTYIRFRDKTNGLTAAYGVGVDDLKLEVIPTSPVFGVLPLNKDFGTLGVGSTSAVQNFTVSNTGIGTLTITSATFTGANANQFEKIDSAAYPVNLTEGQSYMVGVKFKPTSAGLKNANLTFANSNIVGAVYDVPLTGTGYALGVPFTENFEGTFPPVGWERYNGLMTDSTIWTSTTSGWIQDDFANILTPVNKSARINIYGTTMKYLLSTPPIVLPVLDNPALAYKLEFDLALTKYSAVTPDTLGVDDKFIVVLSTDGGTSWKQANYLRTWNNTTYIDSGAGQHITINLPAGIPNTIKIGFYGESTVSNKDNDLFVDNVKVSTDAVIGWCNLQWPGSGAINVGQEFVTYAQIWIDGATPAPGPTPGLNAWIGVSSTNTDPSTWTTWIPATFNVQSGNNDEFMANIATGLTPGTYYYASRFQFLNGPYKYGGFNAGGGGFWDGTGNVSGVLTVNSGVGPLAGDYFIPKGANPKGFPTLVDAFKALDTLGATDHVKFLIDGDLNETGAQLVLSRNDLSSSKTLTIKPAPTKTPTITITGCVSTSGATQYSGMSFNGASWITIDGSNATTAGTADVTKDMTIAMSDSAVGLIGITLYGNCDNITIKNLKLKYLKLNQASASSRGIYVNGQASGVVDSFIVKNCEIGDENISPFYAISVTGYATAPLYCSKVYVQNNLLYAKMRLVYFYYVGVADGYCEIAGNDIKGVKAPITGNVVWGILFNYYNGKIEIKNNKLVSLRDTTNNTSGLYGIGTLSGQTAANLKIYNNFLGGDFIHSGVGIPASVDVISFQDNVPNADVYYNTIVLNNMPVRSSGRMTGVRWGGTANVNVKNNIIVNMKNDSLAMGIWAGNNTFTADNNNFYIDGPLAQVGYYNGTKLKTLQLWRDSTGKDLNSINVTVPFVSATDLHIVPNSVTYLKGGATPIAGITTDIDGNQRHGTTPDIGADEFIGTRPTPVVNDTFHLAVGTVWNILSVPLTPVDPLKTALFPTAQSNAYTFDGTGYVTKDTLAVGYGYWLKFNVPDNVTIVGQKVNSKVINLANGWNFIGSLDKDLGAANVVFNPQTIVASPFYGYNDYYFPTTTLHKGRGFWVKTNATGTLTLSQPTLKNIHNAFIVEAVESNSKVINVADAAGKSFRLYIQNNVEKDQYELPPVPPTGIFDVRFATQKFVEKDASRQIIELNSLTYPVKIMFNNLGNTAYVVKDAVNGTLFNSFVKDGQELVINNSFVNRIVLEKIGAPTSFELFQNYPNPFNPNTTIRYQIPEKARVTLEVYNSLGQKVRTLINVDQEVGYYNVDLDGKELSSGAYYIRLQAGDYVKIIKALMIK